MSALFFFILTLECPAGRFYFLSNRVPGTLAVMSRKYGKPPKHMPRKRSNKEVPISSFKIKLRGRDGAPLSMDELQQGLYDIGRKLKPFENIRAKWVTLYLTAVNEDGAETVLDPAGEWVVYPYKSAADEHGA